jgi:LmbE family N-acetylglucosaminyl deacetylase
MYMQNISVFIFAHQDDEFGVYAELVRLIKNGTKVIVVYLTSGSLDGKPRPDRETESLDVLRDIGVMKENIFFLGTDLHIPDGRLYEYLDTIYPQMLNLLNPMDKITSLYFLSWEGGHQDHDATHIIGLALAKQLKILDNTFQFTLYSGHKLPWILFKLFSPLASNGKAITYKTSFYLRLRFIKYILSYRSQFIPMVGLFPFFLFHHIFKGTQILQPVTINRILEQPHPGKLLYERRGVFTYNEFNEKVQDFIKSFAH